MLRLGVSTLQRLPPSVTDLKVAFHVEPGSHNRRINDEVQRIRAQGQGN